ncbi:MAG: hypothetical protein V7629_03480 [Motiliproteus sp.]
MPSVKAILAKGHLLRVDQGRLCLESASNAPIPDGWLQQHYQILVADILKQTGIDALSYESYSTGRYGPKMVGGVTLQCISLLTNADRYAIFNAELDRARNIKTAKAGSPLPNGQFRVGKKSHLYRFWLSTGLKQPPRLSSLHDYMGKLKGILFIANTSKGSRLDCSSIQPLSLTHQQLLAAFDIDLSPDKPRTNSRQTPDNCQTSKPDKKNAPPVVSPGFQPDPATGADSYGNTVKGNAVSRVDVNPLSLPMKPIEQTTDDWLADYAATE